MKADDPQISKYSMQAYQRPSLPFDKSPGIHTLLGPRRIGKSTQFKLWMRELLQDKTLPASEVQYLDVERYESWKELLEVIEPIKAKYLFIDERGDAAF